MGQSYRSPTETDTQAFLISHQARVGSLSLSLALCLLDFPLGQLGKGEKEGAHRNYLSKILRLCFPVQFFTQTDVDAGGDQAVRNLQKQVWYIYKQKWVQMQMERSNSSEPSITENTTEGDMLSYVKEGWIKAMT